MFKRNRITTDHNYKLDNKLILRPLAQGWASLANEVPYLPGADSNEQENSFPSLELTFRKASIASMIVDASMHLIPHPSICFFRMVCRLTLRTTSRQFLSASLLLSSAIASS
jgi:hypothetical protein